MYLRTPHVDPQVCNNEENSALDVSANSREYALAIVARLLELGVTVNGEEKSTDTLFSRSGRVAEGFIAALQDASAHVGTIFNKSFGKLASQSVATGREV